MSSAVHDKDRHATEIIDLPDPSILPDGRLDLDLDKINKEYKDTYIDGWPLNVYKGG